MWKNVLFTMWFLDFVTVFKESYNCQTSHNLGRNQLPKPLLLPLDIKEKIWTNLFLISRLSWLCNFLHSDFRRLPIVLLSSIFYADLVYCAMPHCFLLASTWYLKNFSSLLTHLFIFFGCQAGVRPHEATWPPFFRKRFPKFSL